MYRVHMGLSVCSISVYAIYKIFKTVRIWFLKNVVSKTNVACSLAAALCSLLPCGVCMLYCDITLLFIPAVDFWNLICGIGGSRSLRKKKNLINFWCNTRIFTPYDFSEFDTFNSLFRTVYLYIIWVITHNYNLTKRQNYIVSVYI